MVYITAEQVPTGYSHEGPEREHHLNKIKHLMKLVLPMSEKDLQRLTSSVDDIDHGSNPRRELPLRRHHITQKVKIAGSRTLYISVHDDLHPAEVFLRIKAPNRSDELIGPISRLMSLVLQYELRLEKVGDLLHKANLIPAAGIWRLSAGGCGPQQTHDPGGKHDEQRQTDR